LEDTGVELTHSFTVDFPADLTWAVITDLERVAPCLPGAALVDVDGEDHRGAVTVTVGAVTAQYEGTARFVERDDDAHHAVIRAEGRDMRGQGTAAATIDLRLRRHGDGTEIWIDTDLALAGRAAQFGRGVIADVSSKLMGQFAQRLEAEMAGSAPASGAPAARAVSAPRVNDEVEPLDPMAARGRAVLAGVVRRQAVPVVAAVLGLLIGLLVGRRGAGITDVCEIKEAQG
jgi:carbon monoxide dehydrogenase subunit G